MLNHSLVFAVTLVLEDSRGCSTENRARFLRVGIKPPLSRRHEMKRVSGVDHPIAQARRIAGFAKV